MTKDEAMKQALDAITQYLAESPDPSEEAVENLCDARAVLGKTLAQPEQEKQPAQKRPQNCGTSYCSCIECVMEPAQQGNGVTMEEAWKLALEALESLSMNDYSGYEISKHETYKIDNAITALREARAEKPAQQEPVAWIRWEWNRSGLRSLTFSKPDEMPLAEEATGVVYDPLYTSSPAQQEPDRSGLTYYRNDKCEAVNALSPDCICWTPMQPAQHKPMTDEEIDSLFFAARTEGGFTTKETFTFFARAIEAAHGIKENT